MGVTSKEEEEAGEKGRKVWGDLKAGNFLNIFLGNP
jgi:hypothetical protein